MGSIANSDKVQATERVEDRIKGGSGLLTGLLYFCSWFCGSHLDFSISGMLLSKSHPIA